ncbi:MAG TPA: NADP oxidoreductase [Candidatus Sumerlaeota bacterium]|nr:MAG: NAD-reducing hydrogenase HoxS subunit delta [candidate division BRC1 bacterium ADurb.BinA292]HOE97670.1 NADP oxidoreductase [Candidatus Sumerlaeota bacterium]HOR28851.1 NADP oxidoreductase [Candidatus Sumerlaeota bacterium]
MNRKIRIATSWLDGCSGCHMSFLDIDERLLTVLDKFEIVYGPLVDAKQVPEGIDVALVEGAVSNQDDLELIQQLRARSSLLISLGDCAVTSNVPAMRNPHPLGKILERVYIENAQADQQIPANGVPPLLRHARPLHEVVKVDLHIPGCPPAPDLIFHCIAELLAGRTPNLETRARFG